MRKSSIAAALALCAGLTIGSGAASAIDLTPIDHAATLKECGACHVAFPPQMLPMRSWSALVNNLSHHFSEDASLPKNTQAEIARYLMTMSADSPGNAEGRVFLRGLSSGDTPLRIVDTPIWQMIHGDPGQSVFKRPEITSPANCAACHRTAAQGQFYGE
jgi:hypothetical protein